MIQKNGNLQDCKIQKIVSTLKKESAYIFDEKSGYGTDETYINLYERINNKVPFESLKKIFDRFQKTLNLLDYFWGNCNSKCWCYSITQGRIIKDPYKDCTNYTELLNKVVQVALENIVGWKRAFYVHVRTMDVPGRLQLLNMILSKYTFKNSNLNNMQIVQFFSTNSSWRMDGFEYRLTSFFAENIKNKNISSGILFEINKMFSDPKDINIYSFFKRTGLTVDDLHDGPQEVQKKITADIQELLSGIGGKKLALNFEDYLKFYENYIPDICQKLSATDFQSRYPHEFLRSFAKMKTFYNLSTDNLFDLARASAENAPNSLSEFVNEFSIQKDSSKFELLEIAINNMSKNDERCNAIELIKKIKINYKYIDVEQTAWVSIFLKIFSINDLEENKYTKQARTPLEKAFKFLIQFHKKYNFTDDSLVEIANSLLLNSPLVWREFFRVFNKLKVENKMNFVEVFEHHAKSIYVIRQEASELNRLRWSKEISSDDQKRLKELQGKVHPSFTIEGVYKDYLSNIIKVFFSDNEYDDIRGILQKLLSGKSYLQQAKSARSIGKKFDRPLDLEPENPSKRVKH